MSSSDVHTLVKCLLPGGLPCHVHSSMVSADSGATGLLITCSCDCIVFCTQRRGRDFKAGTPVSVRGLVLCVWSITTLVLLNCLSDPLILGRYSVQLFEGFYRPWNGANKGPATMFTGYDLLQQDSGYHLSDKWPRMKQSLIFSTVG